MFVGLCGYPHIYDAICMSALPVQKHCVLPDGIEVGRVWSKKDWMGKSLMTLFWTFCKYVINFNEQLRNLFLQ